MRRYYRIMLGPSSSLAEPCFQHGYVGVDYPIHQDLTGDLVEDWQEFNKKFIPVFLQALPHKSRIAAGLACGALWTVAKGLQIDDVVVSPDGHGSYRFGIVSGGYQYVPGEPLPHRRQVTWKDLLVARTDMSEPLRNSLGSVNTVSNVTGHSAELEAYLAAIAAPGVVATDPTIEDPATFALEKHLEDFLVANWSQTSLGKYYDIYKDIDATGQQFQTDTGPIDILAISKDKKKLLVVELKRGRANDVVVGQVLRYMGFVKESLLEPGQSVEGVIIALNDEPSLRRALSLVPSVTFLRYRVRFELISG